MGSPHHHSWGKAGKIAQLKTCAAFFVKGKLSHHYKTLSTDSLAKFHSHVAGLSTAPETCTQMNFTIAIDP